jgi:hypothetical protein
VRIPSAAIPKSSRFAALGDSQLYPGELAYFSTSGQLESARVGSTISGQTGDPILTPTVSNYRSELDIIRLDGPSVRLSTDSLRKLMVDGTNDYRNTALGSQTADAWGVIRIKTVDGLDYAFQPVGAARIEFGQTDGLRFDDNGLPIVSKGEVSVTFAPVFADTSALLKALPAGQLTLKANGVYRFKPAQGDTEYAFRPNGAVENATPTAFSTDGDGLIRFGFGQSQNQNNGQRLQPAFADTASLRKALIEAIPSGKIRFDIAGSVDIDMVDINSTASRYRLLPSYTVSPAPANQAGKSWWQVGDELFVKNSDGTAQGFRVVKP